MFLTKRVETTETQYYYLVFLWPCIMNWLLITNLMHWLLFIH